MLPEARHKSRAAGDIQACAAKGRHELAQAFKAKSFASRGGTALEMLDPFGRPEDAGGR